MRKSVWKILLSLVSLFILFTSVVSAASVESQRAETRQKVALTLEKLYEKQPKARQAIENAAGYAVFVNTGFKLGILGSSHGRGMAYNNKTKEEVFMRMKEFQAGLGLGVKEYAIIFVFGTQDAWNTFVTKGWSFGAQATASANDGKTGDSLEGALQVEPGIWMYQLTTKGLALELSVKGTNYYRDKKLNQNKIN